MKPIYPFNKQLFKKLIPFAQKIISICQKNKITPVIYGSFAHFYYTKDKSMKVNDIDIIVRKKDFPKMVKLLGDNKIKFRYIKEYHDNGMSTIIIKKGKLRVELDEVGEDYKTLNKKNIIKKTKNIDFYGTKVKMISLKQLEDIYQVAYKRTRDNKLKLSRRIKHLENFLGRKLKYI